MVLFSLVLEHNDILLRFSLSPSLSSLNFLLSSFFSPSVLSKHMNSQVFKFKDLEVPFLHAENGHLL